MGTRILNNPIHTVESLQRDLLAAGIVPGDTLLVHSSMKSLGQVAGGVRSVFEALKNAVTSKGLLLFPTFSDAYVTSAHPDFDVAKTPAWTGLLPERFRQEEGVRRSLHPFHSLTAWGDAAEAFVAGHECFDTAFNRCSPWGRLLERKAKTLLVGVDLTKATFLHAVEEWSGVPVLSQEPVLRYIIDLHGNRMPRTIRWHTGAHSENFFRAEPLLLTQGALTRCRVGDAACLLMDCCKTFECLGPLLRQNPAFFAHGMVS